MLSFLLLLQAKTIAEPFAYDEYRKKKIREKIEAERANRVVAKVTNLLHKEQICSEKSFE